MRVFVFDVFRQVETTDEAEKQRKIRISFKRKKKTKTVRYAARIACALFEHACCIRETHAECALSDADER